MFPDRDTRADETATAGSGQETTAAPGVVRSCPLAATAPPPATAAQQQQHGVSAGPPHSDPLGRVCITVAPFTGGPFEVSVNRADTIEELKRVIARRLKVAKERIYLLYRDSELSDGSVSQNMLVDGSTVTLLPRAETGLISPKPEQSVMQALESLNEQQVNDFLSGAAPLNLTMRLGDHMMLIQLQLSTVNQMSSSSSRHHTSSSSSRTSSSSSSSRTSSSPPHYHNLPPTTATADSLLPQQQQQQQQKVRLPLLSPGGLYTTSQRQQQQQQHSGLELGPPLAKKPRLDTRALAEASKNLTQTLKQLSSEVLITRPEGSSQQQEQQHQQQQQQQAAAAAAYGESTPRPRREGERSSRKRKATAECKGAIIESMHHHGKGVYSGTFSGTLNPALQDCNGQPKRDITTIVHILNDLLCAQYKAYSSSSSSGSSSSRHHHHHHHHHRSHRSSEARAAAAAAAAAENKADVDPSESQLLQDQLNVTRTKMEALRRKLEKLRMRREARKQEQQRQRQQQARSYSTAWSVAAAASSANNGLRRPPAGAATGEESDSFLPPKPEIVTA